MIYQKICEKHNKGLKQLALLIDPDKFDFENSTDLINTINKSLIDFILIGGSLISKPIKPVVEIIKKNTILPIILYPGSLLQIENTADAIFLLSLISGRNPEFLIGNHVIAAPLLKKSNLEVISTGYILIDGGNTTSVEYMSNTMPIPQSKPDIALATAIAGELLGMKLIYLDAGSGAVNKVSSEIIKTVKQNLSVPLIVGGGIRTVEELKSTYNAGADIIVIGTAFENNQNLITDFANAKNSFH